jgi:hypothetical protein
MTRARTASFGLVTPPPLYRWIDAVLMLFAELVSYAVSTLQMVLVRRTRECHTQAAPEDLPRATSGLHQETDQAAPTGLSTGSGLSAASPAKAGVQTPHSVRTHNSSALRALTGPPPSRGTRVEKALSPLSPTNVGIQGGRRTVSYLAASSLHPRQNRSWIPTAHPELVEGRRNERFMWRDIRLT